MKTIFAIQSATPRIMEKDLFLPKRELKVIEGWKYSCPIKDCLRKGFIEKWSDFLRHLTMDHFRDKLEELTKEDLIERKCKICHIIFDSPNDILVHYVNRHDGFGKILGDERTKKLLNSSKVES